MKAFPPTPPPDPKPVNRVRQMVLFTAGVIVLLFAVVNLLFDFGVVSQSDLESLRVRIFYTATPALEVQFRPAAGVPMQPEDSQEKTAVPAATLPPTAVSITTQDSGFLPLKIEQADIKTVAPEINQAIPLVVPERILIPSINLDAPIVLAEQDEVETGGVTYAQWKAPDYFAGGWHRDSAGLGQVGNTVINGHHNIRGEVFKDLHQLTEGDRISIYGEDEQRYAYLVTNVMILEERDVSLEERLNNARWILPSEDERLTLITCWPYTSNTHRLVIVAKPLETDAFPHAK